MPQYTLTIGGQPQDLENRRIVLGRLTVSYRTGRLLSFHQAVRHDQADFQPGQSVLLEVDGAVVFRGQVGSVTHAGRPGEERVEYAAVGLRALSRRVTACEADGLPRLVFNAEPDDEDYRSDRTGMTVGQMLKQLIDGHADQLRALGVITGSGYLQGELDQLDAVPSRVVLRERDFDRAVSEILAHQPGWVFQVHPAEQRYRFQRVDTLPAVTVTVGGEGKVLANLLSPDLSTRYTAVHIVGEEEMTPAVVSVSDGGLSPEWDPAKESDWTLAKALAPADSDGGTVSAYTSNTITDQDKAWQADRWAGGRVVVSDQQTGASQTLAVLSNTADTLTLEGTLVISPASYAVENGVSDYRYVFSRWRVTDPAGRRIAPVIPGGTYAPTGWVVFQRTYKPVVCEKRDFGGGTGYFYRDAQFDYDQGRFLTTTPLARGDLDQPGAATGPDDVLLIYARRGSRLYARYPAEGFAGTAYTRFGLAREKVIHDEQFVSGDELAQYQALAQELHRALCDVVYSGTVALAELDFSLVHLGKRVNLTGIDRAGNPVTTGWETVQALLDAVTYDLARGTTRLDLTTDTSDLSLPYAELRQRLRTRDRLRELETQLRYVRRRLRRSPGAPPPDPDALHRGLIGVESLNVPGGEERIGRLTLQGDDSTVTITNPFAGDETAFDFAVNTDLIASRDWVSANFAAARDVPSPSDASPADVGPAPAAGTSDDYSRGDHVHRGVTSVAKSGGAAKYGNVTFSEGTGIDINVVGNDLEIALDSNEAVTSFDADIPGGAGPEYGDIKLYWGVTDPDDPIVIYNRSGEPGYPASGAFEILFASSYFPKAEITTAGGARPLNDVFTNLKFTPGMGVTMEWADADDDNPELKFRLASFADGESWSVGSGLGSGCRIADLDDPVNAQDAATKHYVDNKDWDYKGGLEADLNGAGDGILIFDDGTDTVSTWPAAAAGNLLAGNADGTWGQLTHPAVAGKVIQTTVTGWEFIDTPSGGLPAGTSGDLLHHDGTDWQAWDPTEAGELIYADTADSWAALSPPKTGGNPDGALLQFDKVNGVQWLKGSAGDILIRGSDGWTVLSQPGSDGDYVLKCSVSAGAATFSWVEASGEVGYFLPGAASDYDMWLRWYIADTDEYPMWDYLP